MIPLEVVCFTNAEHDALQKKRHCMGQGEEVRIGSVNKTDFDDVVPVVAFAEMADGHLLHNGLRPNLV